MVRDLEEDMFREDEVFDMTQEDEKSTSIQAKLELFTGNMVKATGKNINIMDSGDMKETIDQWEKKGFLKFKHQMWTTEGLAIAMGLVSSMEKTENDYLEFAKKIEQVKRTPGYEDHFQELINVSPALNEIFNWNHQIIRNYSDYSIRFTLVFRIFKIFFNKFSVKMEEGRDFRERFVENRDTLIEFADENKNLKEEIKGFEGLEDEMEKLQTKLTKQTEEVGELRKKTKELENQLKVEKKNSKDGKVSEAPVVEEKKEEEIKPEEKKWVIIKEDGKEYFHCLKKKCGHTWRPRNGEDIDYNKLPIQCPRCHSTVWRGNTF